MPAFLVPANLAFDTYGDLVEAIGSWLDRSDLSGDAQQMVALADARINRLLSPSLPETSLSITTDTSGIGALPTDCSAANRISYNGYAIPNVSQSAGLEYAAGSVPQAFSLEQGAVRLWPATAVTVTLLYQPRLGQLSEGSPTNAILDAHPDVYFFGALMFAEGYLANDNRAAMFKQLWDEALDECRSYLRRQKHGRDLTRRLVA
jgi:hypothetical protein